VASGAAKRYAQAVFEIAREQNALDRWSDELAILDQLARDPEMMGFLSSPEHSEAEKKSLMTQALQTAQPEARRLGQMLIDRRRLGLIPDLVAAFQELVLDERGIAVAHVTTAVPLDAEAESMVRAHLQEIIGKQIELRSEVDPAIIGGLVARVGDTLIDGSVASSLRRMRERLATTR
jgi:F-type H+-transporting ATPase subunit delta